MQRRSEKRTPKSRSIDVLCLEYEQCSEGYNSRDLIAADEFFKLIQSFSLFLAILLGISIFGEISTSLRAIIGSILGILGFVTFLSFLLDIQGACSCKLALRRRAQEIERELEDFESPRIWKAIDERDRFFEESLLKKVKEDGAETDGESDSKVAELEKETEGALFVAASRLVIVLWVAIVVITLVWGDGVGS